MGNFDKAFKSKQRMHRERVNVLGKGFLERKKDYQVRAAEYNRRQTIITKLRKKTLDKNPDEFYFRMKRSHLVDGVHHDLRRDDEDREHQSPEELRMMQTQDLNYVNYKRSIDTNRIERLQSELHLIDGDKPRNRHTFFVDSDAQKAKFNFAKRMKVDRELLAMGFNIANPSSLADVRAEDVVASNQIKAMKYRRLDNKLKREQFLKTLSVKMQTKKCLLNKRETAKKIRPGTEDRPAVYKWKAERKK